MIEIMKLEKEFAKANRAYRQILATKYAKEPKFDITDKQFLRIEKRYLTTKTRLETHLEGTNVR